MQMTKMTANKTEVSNNVLTYCTFKYYDTHMYTFLPANQFTYQYSG